MMYIAATIRLTLAGRIDRKRARKRALFFVQSVVFTL
jgi:hypothetical protein